jgi:hypothetical protein
MNREVHVRICEGLGVKFPGPTRQKRPKLPWLPAVKRCYGAGDEGMAPSLLPNNLMERPVKRNDLSQSLIAFDHSSTLVAVVELSFGSWLAAGLVPHLSRQPLKKLRPDPDALLRLLLRWRDQAKNRWPDQTDCAGL